MSWHKKNGSGGDRLHCRAYATESTTIPSGAWTPISMAGIDSDTDEFHTSDATKFQINTSGLYLITHQEYLDIASLTWDQVHTINTGIIRNGNEIIACAQPSNDGNVSALVYLNKGDYIQPALVQSSGKSVSTFIGSSDEVSWRPYVSIVQLSN